MPTTPPHHSFRVLIVDDNSICSDILARVIRSQHLDDVSDVHITTLRSAESVLQTLNEKNYDIIFTDIEMGELSGDEMARIIRKNNYDIPIYAVTARSDNVSRDRYKSAGITDCLAKPVNKANVHTIVENILRKTLNVNTVKEKDPP